MFSSIELVIVGHLAQNEDRTPHGRQTSLGGSAYYCAKGASIVDGKRVGVVADVGEGFAMKRLRTLDVDLDGITTIVGQDTARFVITQKHNDRRVFRAHWGASARARPHLLPSTYWGAAHFHLASMPPAQQLAWADYIRVINPVATISIDLFEPFVRSARDQVRACIEIADLIFANEEEAGALGLPGALGSEKRFMLKRGPRGATNFRNQSVDQVPAPAVDAIDTTGAGEVLAGGWLSLVGAGVEAQIALRHAVAIASATVRDFGVDHPAVDMAIESARHELSLDPVA